MDQVALAGLGDSLEARQGETVHLRLRGRHLLRVRTASLGEGTNAIALAPDPASAPADGEILLILVTPHATAPGERSLHLGYDAGTVDVADAIDVTGVAASPQGDDGARGTPDDPFLSLAHAVEVAQAGDTVVLAAGTFSNATTGDTFQLDVSGLTIAGAAGGVTLLDGGAGAPGLRIEDADAWLEHLEMQGFGTAAYTSGSGAVPLTLHLDHVVLHDNNGGIVAQGPDRIDGDYVTVQHNTLYGLDLYGSGASVLSHAVLSGNGGAGAVLMGPVGLTLTHGVLKANAMGLQMALGASAGLTDTIVESNAGVGLEVDATATLTMHGGEVMSNGLSGIDASGAGPGTVALDGTNVHDNGDAGVQFGGPQGTLVLSRVTLHANAGDAGLVVSDAPERLELDRVTATANDGAGVELRNGSDATVTGGRFDGNGSDGLVVEGNAAITAPTPVSMSGNGHFGLVLFPSATASIVGGATIDGNVATGVYLAAEAAFEMAGGSISHNGGSGLDATDLSDGHDVSLQSVAVEDNASDGILTASDDGTLVLRACQVRSNGGDGVRVQADPSIVDLGTDADPGANDIEGNAGTQLVDARPAGASATIHAAGDDLGSVTIITGLQTGTDSAPPYWAIVGSGNQIDFGSALAP